MEDFENAVKKKKKSITEPPIAKLENRELRRGIVHF